MIFDPASENIILISYPSGGFGNFLYYLLSKFCLETVDINDDAFKFSLSGDSHSIIKYTNPYFMDPPDYDPSINVKFADKKILVLCDNGIGNDQYHGIRNTFPNATIVRSVIDTKIRPVIYQTCVIKARRSSMLLENTKHINDNWSDSAENYAVRENFTLLYHNWPFGWRPDPTVINFHLEKLITDPINTVKNMISNLGLTLTNDDELPKIIKVWYTVNQKYFNIYYSAQDTIDAIVNNSAKDLRHITNLHEQGYINYCIEKHFNVIIPVYDYKDWFKSTNEISEMIKCLE